MGQRTTNEFPSLEFSCRNERGSCYMNSSVKPEKKKRKETTQGASGYWSVWRFLRNRLQPNRSRCVSPSTTCNQHMRPAATAPVSQRDSKQRSGCRGQNSAVIDDKRTLGVSVQRQWAMMVVLQELEACCAERQRRATDANQVEGEPSVSTQADTMHASKPIAICNSPSSLPTSRRRQRSSRVEQSTCHNCHLRFFKEMVPCAAGCSGFCSLDCKSSFEYVHEIQRRVDEALASASTTWIESEDDTATHGHSGASIVSL